MNIGGRPRVYGYRPDRGVLENAPLTMADVYHNSEFALSLAVICPRLAWTNTWDDQ
jgi:hypothetical protein